MTVHQINLWICDRCGATATVLEGTPCYSDPSCYSDPVVTPPAEWNVEQEPPTELRKHPGDDCWDLCSACVALGLIPCGFRDNTAMMRREYYIDGRMAQMLPRDTLEQLPKGALGMLYNSEWRAAWGTYPDRVERVLAEKEGKT
jgi:hypothetical protein